MNPTAAILVVMASCAILGAIVGAGRNATWAGVILGLVFGPLGLIAMLVVDLRPYCRRCGQQVNPGYAVCPFCHVEFSAPDQAAMQRPEPPPSASEVRSELEGIERMREKRRRELGK